MLIKSKPNTARMYLGPCQDITQDSDRPFLISYFIKWYTHFEFEKLTHGFMSQSQNNILIVDVIITTVNFFISWNFSFFSSSWNYDFDFHFSRLCQYVFVLLSPQMEILLCLPRGQMLLASCKLQESSSSSTSL